MLTIHSYTLVFQCHQFFLLFDSLMMAGTLGAIHASVQNEEKFQINFQISK